MEVFKQKDWGLGITIILLWTGSLGMIFHFTYAYGAYKFILLNWWGMCFAIMQGSKVLVTRSRIGRWFAWEGTLVFGLSVFFLLIIPKAVTFNFKVLPYSNVSPFRQVKEVKNTISGGAVLVAVDNDIANEWAVYFLREVPIYLSGYRSYMSQTHVIPLMERAQRIELTNIRYILTD